jgi:hypothetical protein
MATTPFKFNYNYMNYNTAKQQAENQYNPLYNQAVKNLRTQEAQSRVTSGEDAANRGLSHSGLASDALNKIAIATNNQISDLNTTKMSNVASLANTLMQQDQSRGDTLYNRAYQQYRDGISDQRYNQEWNTMSPAEKARMALQYSYSKKASGGGGGGSSKSKSVGLVNINGTDYSLTELQKALQAYTASKQPKQSNLDIYYSNPIIQQAQKTGSKYFSKPTPPAQSRFLTDYEKMKMLFG